MGGTQRQDECALLSFGKNRSLLKIKFILKVIRDTGPTLKRKCMDMIEADCQSIWVR